MLNSIQSSMRWLMTTLLYILLMYNHSQCIIGRNRIARLEHKLLLIIMKQSLKRVQIVYRQIRCARLYHITILLVLFWKARSFHFLHSIIMYVFITVTYLEINAVTERAISIISIYMWHPLNCWFDKTIGTHNTITY